MNVSYRESSCCSATNRFPRLAFVRLSGINGEGHFREMKQTVKMDFKAIEALSECSVLRSLVGMPFKPFRAVVQYSAARELSDRGSSLQQCGAFTAALPQEVCRYTGQHQAQARE